jgi:putative Ca2+/H+ antiporter (TMEM165/GDT1 family)
MQAFLVSTGIVAISEIGDKTQLLALMLAARFKNSTAIVLGIVAATVLNHAAAGAVGSWIASAVDPTILTWVLAALFVGMGIWALVPDTLDNDTVKDATHAFGVFWITAITFFLAEMGDKTQIATAALAARFQDLVPVVAGTTLGMLIADVPAVYFGKFASEKLKGPWFRYTAAALFIVMGVFTLATLWIKPD